MQNYTTTLTTDKSASEVFSAINDVKGWWSGEIRGETDQLDSEFTYQVGNVHFSKQKIIEIIQDKKIVWKVIESKLGFVEKKDEWTGTEIIFEISEIDGKTEVKFTHQGLVPGFECYKDCSNAWSLLVNGNLKRWIETQEVQTSPF